MKLRSNEPFFLIRNGCMHSYPSLRVDTDTDILIVGAGITGALIAHQCCALGYRTLLLDRREIANGSTSATTAMLQYEIDLSLTELTEKIGAEGATLSYEACYKAIDRLEKVVAEIQSESGFQKKSSLYFADNAKNRESLQEEFRSRQQLGLDVRWLEADDILDRYGIDGSVGGILSSQAASVDAFRLAHDLIYYNFKRGLVVHDKTELGKVDYYSNHVLAHTEHGAQIRAKKIIYCTGFEAVEMIPENFVNLLSTYAIVGEQLPQPPRRILDLLVWNTAQPYLYFRCTADNRLLIGGEDEPFVDARRRDALLNEKSEKLEQQVNRLLPDMDFVTDFSWAGTFGETIDGLPYIGAHPDFPHSYFVLGFGGNGISFSAIGMEMVQSMLEKTTHPLDYYFRFGR